MIRLITENWTNLIEIVLITLLIIIELNEKDEVL